VGAGEYTALSRGGRGVDQLTQREAAESHAELIEPGAAAHAEGGFEAGTKLFWSHAFLYVRGLGKRERKSIGSLEADA